MAFDITRLVEVESARTAEWSVWTDRSDWGIVYHKLNHPPAIGAPVQRFVCVSPGTTTYARMNARTDLPTGTQVRLQDREHSLWTWNGTFWITRDAYTGTSQVPAGVGQDRNVLHSDWGQTLVSPAATTRTLTITAGLTPPGFRFRMFQLGAGIFKVTAGANITAAVLGGTLTKCSGQYATIEVSHVFDTGSNETWTISGQAA